MKSSEFIIKSLCAALLFSAAACSSTSSSNNKSSATNKTATQTSALETVNSEDAPEVAEEKKELAKVITKKGAVANRGGFIKVLVNKTPVTNYELRSRVQFLKLRRVGGNRQQVAQKEMIEQALKLEEASRLRTLATDDQVNKAFASFAKNNRATPAQLSSELNRLGVGAQHFKDFIKTQISWNSTVQRRFQSQTSQVSERDVVTGLRKSGSAKPELTEYAFKQIVFVVPKAKRNSSTLAARKREALAFRQRFPGCDQAINDVKKLRDVSIIDRNRILEPELPERWRQPMINADSKGTTKIVETENGVEFIAICSKRLVSDDRAAVVAQQSEEFTKFNTKSSAVEEKYLDELRSKATIVYQ